ncbi:DNA polymerase delta, subunit 4-domain-containing protein [Pisolithus orientalis]|uniref:DNA polymerase delta, subunit 4-domain-containing protein n=1 Tax=Pisolithus orientalis TaxID=936130 RepID=UPI002224055E|nr:DNA polymerase delta, subunit 4-domain-containing protein [Pisolithus orientalis]KAI5999390.1 DNA polymerase delta, subunit 4-domain-containing protein [Pisolithus orientalis]
MAPARNASKMKQGTLSFHTAKRTNSALNAKSQKPAASESDIDLPSHPSGEFSPSSIPAKRTRDGRDDVQPQRRPRKKHTLKKVEGVPATPERETLDTEDKAGRYRRYYREARENMGHTQSIHGNGGNKIIQMLRFFDMTSEYGPCVGMTRLERWERAETLGLNPPPEVRQILLTKEGVEKEEYAQCVLYGEV